MAMLLSVRLLLFVHFVSSQPLFWSYDDQDIWDQTFPECGGVEQTPIDITINDKTFCYKPLILNWTANVTDDFVMRNNGHSLVAVPFHINHRGGNDLSGLDVLHFSNDTQIRLPNIFYNTYRSLVNKEYCLDSLHFHWHFNSSFGSEHNINGRAYPLEVHFVHYSCDYELAGDAVRAYINGDLEQYDDDNILAVIGVLFEIGDPNPVLDNILNNVIIDNIRKYEAFPFQFLIKMYYQSFNLFGLLPANKEMIAYKGSLTTPPCFETVRWHVLKQTMTVSEEQMYEFRRMLQSMDEGDFQMPNWRKLKPIGDRVVYKCQDDIDDLTVPKEGQTTTTRKPYSYLSKYPWPDTLAY